MPVVVADPATGRGERVIVAIGKLVLAGEINVHWKTKFSLKLDVVYHPVKISGGVFTRNLVARANVVARAGKHIKVHEAAAEFVGVAALIDHVVRAGEGEVDLREPPFLMNVVEARAHQMHAAELVATDDVVHVHILEIEKQIGLELVARLEREGVAGQVVLTEVRIDRHVEVIVAFE